MVGRQVKESETSPDWRGLAVSMPGAGDVLSLYS